MSHSPEVRLVAVALIEDGQDGQRFLVARRRPEVHLGGAWELPGGKIEAGESPEGALIRELREELGLSALPEDLQPLTFSFFTYPARTVLLLFYRLPWQPERMGAPRPLDATELRWLDRDGLLALPMPPANEPLKALLRQGLPDPTR